jgi:hypothetical protein
MSPEKTKIPKGLRKYMQKDPSLAREIEKLAENGISKEELFRIGSQGRGVEKSHISNRKEGKKVHS